MRMTQRNWSNARHLMSYLIQPFLSRPCDITREFHSIVAFVDFTSDDIHKPVQW